MVDAVRVQRLRILLLLPALDLAAPDYVRLFLLFGSELVFRKPARGHQQKARLASASAQLLRKLVFQHMSGFKEAGVGLEPSPAARGRRAPGTNPPAGHFHRTAKVHAETLTPRRRPSPSKRLLK